MTIRVDDLVIPNFASTEEAVAWGEQQKPADLRVIIAVYKTLERIALTSTDLQRKLDYALEAQLVREAAEAVPAPPTPNHNPAPNRSGATTFPHDRPDSGATGSARIAPQQPIVRETSS